MTKIALLLIFIAICSTEISLLNGSNWPEDLDNFVPTNTWHGKWFPQPPDKPFDDNPTAEYETNVVDDQHGIKMGISNPDCDNGQTNLTMDWDNSPINYTCFEDKSLYLPNFDTQPILHCDHIPKYYSAPHKCMNTSITYEDDIPSFGIHRPLWPKFGEYLFLPRQRWLHSLEHGAIVMLYHPCANKQETLLLKELVTGCLYRHIITPYTLLQPERPFALVAWGCRLVMSKVDAKIVIEFIKQLALNGPEQKYEDGQFDFGLIHHAKIVSDASDTELCPNF